MEKTPIVRYFNGQGRIRDLLRDVGREVFTKLGGPPNLFVVVLPEGGNEIYTEVKQYVQWSFLSLLRFCSPIPLVSEILKLVSQ